MIWHMPERAIDKFLHPWPDWIGPIQYHFFDFWYEKGEINYTMHIISDGNLILTILKTLFGNKIFDFHLRYPV